MSKNNHSTLSNQVINLYIPSSQKPFQYAFQSSVKINQNKFDDIAIILTKHYVFCLNSNSSSNKKILIVFDMHISEINHIEKKSGKNVYIGSSNGDPSIIINNIDKHVTKFSQLLFRNIILSYYDSNDVVLKWDDKSNFPPIDIQFLSPSQIFQFNYFAYCTQNEYKYSHDFVRYVHNLIVEDSPIIDLSILSPKYFQKKIVKSLKCAKNIFRGICLKDFSYPDVFKAFAKLLVNNSNIKIVTFSNCNCTKGLKALSDALENSNKKKSSFNVAYWDLSYNEFKNFSFFSKVIENSIKPIRYLNINGCNICDEDTRILFSSLENFIHIKKLKFLSIAGASFDSSKSIHSFKRFLQVCNLTYLDLGSIADCAGVIAAIRKVGIKNLKTLILNNTLLEANSPDDLLQIIEYSDSLCELDISGTGLRVESISSIIETINDNKNLNNFSIKLNSLQLYGDYLKSIIKAFMGNELNAFDNRNGRSSSKSKHISSKLKQSSKKSPLAKWRSLSFASNEMTNEDLNKLIKLFGKMKNLEMVYLDDNFDSSMSNIGDSLCDLLRLDIPLIGISLAGSKKHKLQDELISFLKDAAKNEILEYLNIENNDLQDNAIQSINNLLNMTNSLKTLKIDNNSFTSINKIKSIVDAVEYCQTLTTFGFPIFDSVRICENDGEGRMEEKLVNLQSRSNFVISQHRRDILEGSLRRNGLNNDIIFEKLKCQVPFEVENDDVERLLATFINKYPKISTNKRNRHSFACELFDLPFPFQQYDELPSDCRLDILKQDNSDNLKVYDKNGSLIEYIKEPPRQSRYLNKNNRISYLPTYGPTIDRILDDDYLEKPMNDTSDQFDFKRKRKVDIQIPSDIKQRGKNEDDQNSDGSLSTRKVDSRNLDELVDTRLNEEENVLKSKKKTNKFDNTRKKKRNYDNESLKKVEYEKPRKERTSDITGRSIYDEYSNDENNTNYHRKMKKQKPTSGKSKLKLTAKDDSYSNSEDDEDDENDNLLRRGQRINRVQSDQDYSSGPPKRREIRRPYLRDESDSDTDEEVRIGKKNQLDNRLSDSSTTSEIDDANTPFTQQKPIKNVVHVSTDSYIINRNRNRDNDDEDDDDDLYDNLSKNRSVYSKRNRKGSTAYDSSPSIDNSLNNSDDNDTKQEQQPKYDDIDIFKVSTMPKPPHLKSPQDALKFAYDLMHADQSEEQNNSGNELSDN